MSEPRDLFAQELANDVEEAVASPDAFSVFSSVMFTHLVLERLEEAGRIEEPSICFRRDIQAAPATGSTDMALTRNAVRSNFLRPYTRAKSRPDA